MSIGIEDVPNEILLHIMDLGNQLDIPNWAPSVWGHQEALEVKPWEKVWNRACQRRAKPLCRLMAGVSRPWFDLVQNTPTCWYLQVDFPGVRMPYKYDIALDVAQSEANLKASAGCDICVSIGYVKPSSNFREPQLFSLSRSGLLPTNNDEVDGMQYRLLLATIARLRPYACRIISFGIWTWGDVTTAAIISLLRFFGPMPRLWHFTCQNHIFDWREERASHILPGDLHGFLGLATTVEPIHLSDFAFLTSVVSYHIDRLTPATILPPNLSDLTLRIWNRSYMDTMTWSTIERALHQSPRLRKLDLGFNTSTPEITWEGCDPRKQRIRLVDLQQVVLVADCNVALFILSTLDAPQLQKLNFAHRLPNIIWVPDDNVLWNREHSPINSIRFPRLSDIRFRNLPIGHEAPLRYFDQTTPVLRSLTWSDGSNIWNFRPRPISTEPISTRRPAISTKSILVTGTVLENPIHAIHRLLSQLDLLSTEEISLFIELDKGSGTKFFDPESHATVFDSGHPLLPYIDRRLSAPHLHTLKLKSLHCIHIAELVIGIFKDANRLIKISITDLKNPRCSIRAPSLPWENLATSNLLALQMDLSAVSSDDTDPRDLNSKLSKALILMPSMFRYIQMLEIVIECSSNERCQYLASKFEDRLRSLSRDLGSLGNLPFLACLRIRAAFTHGRPVSIIRNLAHARHPSLRSIYRLITQATKCILMERKKDLEKPGIREVYLLLVDVPRISSLRSGISEVCLRLR
jgi:hypothetical protein